MGPRRKSRQVFALWCALCLFILTIPTFGATGQEVMRWFRQAQMLERLGRPGDAVGLYRRVWQAQPERFDAAVRGAELLMELHREEDARAWLAQAAQRTPQVALVWATYGDVLDRMGRSEQADSVWSRGAERCRDPRALYMGVVERLRERGDLSRARLWAERGRMTGDAIFSRLLYEIALSQGRYWLAAGYAAEYVRGIPARVDETLEAIRRAEPTPAAWDSMASVSLAASQEDSLDAGKALLAAELALAAGNQLDAGTLYLRAVRHGRTSVQEMLSLAEQLDARGHTLIAAMLYEEIAAQYPRTPLAVRATVMAARRYAHEGRAERARMLYRRVVAQGNTRYADEAHLALGRLLLEANATEEAREHFAAVARRGRTATVRREGTFGLAECLLREGLLDEAARILRRLAIHGDAFSDAAKARLRLAEIEMYRGDAGALEERCRALLQETPDADEANDCLEMTGILAEAAGDTLAWQRYGRLRYLLTLGMADSVLAGVHALEGTPLAGRGLLLAAEAHLSKANPQAAAENLRAAASRFKGTALGEEAQWRLAEVYRTHLRDPREALRAYETLLREYPKSVYLGPARRWVRRLRTETGAT